MRFNVFIRKFSMNPSSSSKPGIPPHPTQSAAEKMDALAKADSFSEQPVRDAAAALAPAESTQDAPGATPPAESAAKGEQSPSGPASPSRADKWKEVGMENRRGLIVVVGNTKGGCGKTTVATNLVAALFCAGKEVMLIDTNIQQESATKWSSVRNGWDLTSRVTCATKTGKIGTDLIKLAEKYDYVVVDVGGSDSVELRQAITVCDRLIVPVRPSVYDSWAMNEVVDIIEGVEKNTGRRPYASVVLNAVSTNPQVTEAAETREYILSDCEGRYPTFIDILPTAIGDRIAFRRSAREGKGVVELVKRNADAAATNEIQRFYEEVFNEPFVLV
jgi:chromosome partitioning protein